MKICEGGVRRISLNQRVLWPFPVLILPTELSSPLVILVYRSTGICCYRDYHLGQVLITDKDFVIIDFEGEPARPISERGIKRSSLRDVVGMLRSFH